MIDCVGVVWVCVDAQETEDGHCRCSEGGRENIE